MKVRFFHTVNLGLYLQSEDHTGVFLDGIHLGKQAGFSNTPASVINDCCNGSGVFCDLKALIFSHCHYDHFDPENIARITEKTGLPVYAPQNQLSTIREMPVAGSRMSAFSINDIQFYVLRTIHDGKAYQKEPHRSFIIRVGDEAYFFAGDAMFSEDQIEPLLQAAGGHIDAAFVNAYQIGVPYNSNVLRALSADRHILLHTAFPEDFSKDNKYFSEFVVAHYPKDLSPLIIPEHMQWLSL